MQDHPLKDIAIKVDIPEELTMVRGILKAEGLVPDLLPRQDKDTHIGYLGVCGQYGWFKLDPAKDTEVSIGELLWCTELRSRPKDAVAYIPAVGYWECEDYEATGGRLKRIHHSEGYTIRLPFPISTSKQKIRKEDYL